MASGIGKEMARALAAKVAALCVCDIIPPELMPAILFGHGNPMNAQSSLPGASSDYLRPYQSLSTIAGGLNYHKLGPRGCSVPTPDHYLPVLYVIATRQPCEDMTFPVEGVDGGSISMLSVREGQGNTK